MESFNTGERRRGTRFDVKKVEQMQGDRRQFVRVEVNSPCRYLVAGIEHMEAMLADVSQGGAAIMARNRPRMGEKVIAYVNHLIRLEGQVVRYFRGGFAIIFKLSQAKLVRVLRHLYPAAAEAFAKAESQKVEVESLPAVEKCECRYLSGEKLEGVVTDLSVVGASFRSILRPPVGTRVMLGNTQAKVVRYTPDGFALEFEKYWETAPKWYIAESSIA